ncbi:zinc finger protein-like 1 homolog [Leptopilina boulardi]|uniref:zinc finger protein-like 1 homolog n=1 Tax=Leptopilina boulardi TaxID=63433 RepID=UPI0021F6272D|nr:zinc finger protein-like 1 homolog [Leptopilina boulardi]
MGLCKCPWRRVTNQFCFEHRVNVCENCMVTNHPKCIVQSYLQWLQDSDWTPVCTLCSENLNEGDCVRLICYHVYHWRCLDKFARNLPATTAPAGYTCPICQSRIFPQSNLVSPVADVLREKLAGVNWARAGLGLPLLSEDREQKPVQERKASVENSAFKNHSSVAPPASPSTSSTIATSRTNSLLNSTNSLTNNVHVNNQKVGPPYSVVNIDATLTNQIPRKVFEAYDEPKDVSFDHDENKYQRKSAIDWFLRWWKLISRSPARRRNNPGSLYKRYVLLAVGGFIAFIFIVILFSWLGKMATDGDPSFNVFENRQINVQHDDIAN